MHELAKRVLSHIRRQELLKAGDRVGVAVSGGIDSVALLRLLLELRAQLGIVISIFHFNHKLRGSESDADEQFVARLAAAHDLQFHSDQGDVVQHAAAEHLSPETAARELRYGFFRHLLGNGRDPGKTRNVDKIATGHTLDDQAETVLMRLIRGAGLRGLGGIYPRIHVEDDERGACSEIVRPLLTVRRVDLTGYLNSIGQPWREDATNADLSITRNRVRNLVVPLLEREFNPSVAENLAELAEIAREEEDYWQNEVAGWMGTAVHWSAPKWTGSLSAGMNFVHIAAASSDSSPSLPKDSNLQSRITEAQWLIKNATVDRLWFLGEPPAVQRRLVRAIAEHAGFPLEFNHVEEVLHFAADPLASGKELSLPHGWRLLCHREEMIFLTPDLRETGNSGDYEYTLSVPGRTCLSETGTTFEVCELTAGKDPSDQLLDAESLPGPLTLRNWRPGDRFWPAHTKSPKKIKELLQERQVPQTERRSWPLIVSGEEIVWLRGFPVPARFRARPGQAALRIAEISFGE